MNVTKTTYRKVLRNFLLSTVLFIVFVVFLCRVPNNDPIFLILLIAGLVFGIVMIILGFTVFRLRKKIVSEVTTAHEEREDSLDMISGILRNFSFDDLKAATADFSKVLGRGGFGSVFEGTLSDGTKVAVKRLEQLHQGRKEFEAEVKTIGSVHHFNLVRLVGFCSESLHTLLAYEYMCNGSLDKWIFGRNQETTLDWLTRRNIILGIAKGLSYLHEDCREKIVHLDIKPQNILLDEKFNAKVSDFGLARLINKDQSQVSTTVRGTLGYMAPDWFSNRKISEKVDVYSFGVVVLEIVCGRKNLSTDGYLLHLVKSKIDEDQLHDVVDKQSEDLQKHKEEAVKMVRTAIWCLQGDPTRRPSMSMVVKVLEGDIARENISDFGFLTLAPMELPRQANASSSAPLLTSILSGPR